MDLSLPIITLRLILSVILGGLIGLERESHGRPAGFRTHTLVCLGSTLVMIISAYGMQSISTSYDPGRIAAQVISGIGFLGAGTIMREGVNVRGLTTAASLWAVAGIGLAVGIGMNYTAIIASVLIVLVLTYLNRFEVWHSYTIVITTNNQNEEFEDIFALLTEYDVTINKMSMTNQAADSVIINLSIDTLKKERLHELVIKLNQLDDVVTTTIE